MSKGARQKSPSLPLAVQPAGWRGGVRFSDGREREGPKRFLGNFEGILQSDGYAAYDHLGGPQIVHAACWAHARRKFFQAVELNPEDQRAICIVAQIDELFAIDAQAREQGLSQEDRQVWSSPDLADTEAQSKMRE